MRVIPLTQGKVAMVDDVDYVVLAAFKWCAYRRKHTFYAVRKVTIPGGGHKDEHMHRVVLARKLGRVIALGLECDHDDGDGLNNTRSNLFEKTRRGNAENQHIVKTSQFLGVCKRKNGKWLAQIRVPGEVLYMGLYVTELEAALARERYIAAHPELCACSNFPRGLAR
jgi:hypothetical protein